MGRTKQEISFNQKISIRLRSYEFNKIVVVCVTQPGDYESPSQFVRAAVINFLKKFNSEGQLINRDELLNRELQELLTQESFKEYELNEVKAKIIKVRNEIQHKKLINAVEEKTGIIL